MADLVPTEPPEEMLMWLGRRSPACYLFLAIRKSDSVPLDFKPFFVFGRRASLVSSPSIKAVWSSVKSTAPRQTLADIVFRIATNLMLVADATHEAIGYSQDSINVDLQPQIRYHVRILSCEPSLSSARSTAAPPRSIGVGQAQWS